MGKADKYRLVGRSFCFTRNISVKNPHARAKLFL